MTASLSDRVRGCLLGGAIGDALGAPVEFWAQEQILDRLGPGGVQGYLPATFGSVTGVGLVTDDTQMTLFTVDGLIRWLTRARVKGIAMPDPVPVHRAYLRWLRTQDEPADSSREFDDGWLMDQTWLFSRRAPGSTCLTALASVPAGQSGDFAYNESKGCGAVMRSAPFGFLPNSFEEVVEAATKAAAYTHGHPSGQHAAGALAGLIWWLNQGHGLETAVLEVTRFLEGVREAREVLDSMRHANHLAASGARSVVSVEGLGAGWVAEEALAIGVYCALTAAEPEGIRAALCLAVSHGGDSDSTGAICGNLLGALHGADPLPADLMILVEGRRTILELADDFVAEILQGETPINGVPGLHSTDVWFERYPC